MTTALTIISTVKDKEVFAKVVSKELKGDHGLITFEVDRETFYKLNKFPDNITHDAKLLVYNRDEYMEKLKSLL